MHMTEANRKIGEPSDVASTREGPLTGIIVLLTCLTILTSLYVVGDVLDTDTEVSRDDISLPARHPRRCALLSLTYLETVRRCADRWLIRTGPAIGSTISSQ